MSDDNRQPLDSRISEALASRFRFVSRRGFLSTMSRVMFGAAGVLLPERAFAYVAGSASSQAPPAWERCGLNGFICGTGNCTTAAAVEGSSWTKCCQDTQCTLWFRCTYIDFCGAKKPPKRNKCEGAVPPNTPTWCGVAPDTVYHCTEVKCNTTDGYADQATCEDGFENTCAFKLCLVNGGGGEKCKCRQDPKTKKYACLDGRPAHLP